MTSAADRDIDPDLILSTGALGEVGRMKRWPPDEAEALATALMNRISEEVAEL
jgi:hypothetical protein